MITADDIEKIRRWTRLSKARFAEKLGVDASTYWRWRKGGAISGPALAHLETLREEMLTNPWKQL